MRCFRHGKVGSPGHRVYKLESSEIREVTEKMKFGGS
jgi:hypothetical protein